MKELLEKYFLRLKEVYKEKFGKVPTVSYSEKLDKDMLISEKNEDGEVAWTLKPISNVDLKDFILNNELREYFTSYRFFELNGKLDDINFYFEPLYGDISKKISLMKDNGEYYINGCYCLGSANENENDDLIILYKDGKVLLYDCDTKEKKELTKSLSEIIENMEAIF